MAVIELKPRSLRTLLAALALAILAIPVLANQASDVRAQIGSVATALSAGDAPEAISVFEKSFGNYETLKSYFEALTNAFQLRNEIDVIDEQDTPTETKLTLSWTLTITDRGTNLATRRSSDVNIRLALKNGKWKIVDLSPVELFDPQGKQTAK